MLLTVVEPKAAKIIKSIVINMEMEPVDVDLVPKMIADYEEEIKQLNLDKEYLCSTISVLNKLQKLDDFGGVNTFYAVFKNDVDIYNIRNNRKYHQEIDITNSAKHVVGKRISEIDDKQNKLSLMIEKLQPYEKWVAFNFWESTFHLERTINDLVTSKEAIILMDEED